MEKLLIWTHRVLNQSYFRAIILLMELLVHTRPQLSAKLSNSMSPAVVTVFPLVRST